MDLSVFLKGEKSNQRDLDAVPAALLHLLDVRVFCSARVD